MVTSCHDVTTDVHSFFTVISAFWWIHLGDRLWSTFRSPFAQRFGQVTLGIRTSHHTEWLNGQLELSTYSHLTFDKDDSVEPLVTAATTVGDPNSCRRKEGNVLFHDALNTFYLRLYGVRHMVKVHSDSEKGNPLPPHRLLLSINSKGSFICTIPQTG